MKKNLTLKRNTTRKIIKNKELLCSTLLFDNNERLMLEKVELIPCHSYDCLCDGIRLEFYFIQAGEKAKDKKHIVIELDGIGYITIVESSK
jgi:hypothetical protein